MSREVSIGSRRFWIVSEPHDEGWKAQVLEVVDETGGTQDVGIETTGETRSMADDRAIGQAPAPPQRSVLLAPTDSRARHAHRDLDAVAVRETARRRSGKLNGFTM